jgi:hypothetical protein
LKIPTMFPLSKNKIHKDNSRASKAIITSFLLDR